MIIDIHSHFWDAKEDLLPEVKADLASAGANPELVEITAASHEAGTSGADAVVVFGLRARNTGFVVSNDRVAEFVHARPAKRIGFASADPLFDADPLGEIQRCVEELGMRGVKLAPTYQGVEPLHPKLAEIYAYAEKRGLPVLFHQGTTFSRKAPLKHAWPVLLEDVAYRFPELRMIVAHLGHPWCGETVALIRKQPHIYADISALYYRPYQFYQALKLADEYNTDRKILFGTDYPFTTIDSTMKGLADLEAFIERHHLPPLRAGLLDGIVHRNALELLGLKHPAAKQA
ncbi:MAG: amidohydrolase [Planctomycetes bacterium]|nr:amidohydrolase [Planctomycetota bacterium]